MQQAVTDSVSNIGASDEIDPGESAAISTGGSPVSAISFSFFCPNGHKLKSPASLVGQTGQCPHCDSQFEIPPPPQPPSPEPHAVDTGDSLSAVDSVAPTESIPSFPVADEPKPTAVASLKIGAAEDEAKPAQRIGTRPPISFSSQPRWKDRTHDETGGDSLPEMLATRWSDREHGGIVEIHLPDGTIFAPDYWSRPLSNKVFGVFAIRSSEGGYRIEAICWNSICRLVVRNVEELPGGMFE